MRRQTCTDHCRACGRHFHGLAAYDLHRLGSLSDPTDPRRCGDPAELPRLRAWTEAGACALTGRPLADVTIWQLARAFTWPIPAGHLAQDARERVA